MGANASTAVPVYVSGQVLDAARLNLTNAGIPVFADSTARDAAFGGTGEKTLAEGQFCFLEDSNSTLFYDGAAWQSVGTTPGLVCVKAETAFSAVTEVTADNVFTSAYTNYRIIVRYQTSTTNDLLMKFRASAVDTSTNYNWQRLIADNTTISGIRSASQTSATVGSDTIGAFFSMSTIELSGVQLAEPTIFQSFNSRTAAAYTTPYLFQYFGNQSASTAFDGVKLLCSTGTITGSYTIYGYAKTV